MVGHLASPPQDLIIQYEDSLPHAASTDLALHAAVVKGAAMYGVQKQSMHV